MKRALCTTLAAAVLCAMLASCSSTVTSSSAPAAPGAASPASEATPAAATGGYKVASHNAIIEGNPYRTLYEEQMTEAVAAAKSEGLISEYAAFTANNDPAVESQQIEQTINEGYDIIIVNPIAGTGLDPVIDKALAAGITYINADCEYESEKVLNVVVDQSQWARIQSDFVIKTLGSGSKVVHFKGFDGNSASEMREAVWKAELPAAGIEIVKTMAHGWDDTESQRLMGEVISSGIDYDGIINEESAGGIMNAIEEAKVAYPGCITSSEEVAWIRRISKINATELVCPFIVVENPPGIGATALAVGLNLRQGGELKDGITTGLKGNSIYYTPQWIMTYDNMTEKVDSLADLPDSTSVSSYMTIAQAKEAYFK